MSYVNLEEQIRQTQNAMFAAMGPGFSDTQESLEIETKLKALRDQKKKDRIKIDVVGNMYLNSYA